VLVGAVDIYANHPLILIGSADPPELDLDDAPASASGKHIAVRTRGQVKLTRVSIWNGAMPVIGGIVFDGVLEVLEHQVCVADLENITRWIKRLEKSGLQRVVVCVDDPGYASRVHVGFGLGDHVCALTAVAGHPLPAVRTASDGDLSRPAELGLILDGHDSAVARLAAAMKLLAVPIGDKPWPYPYDIRLLVEWLRGLESSVSFAHAQALGEEIADRMKAGYGSSGVTDMDGIPDNVPLAIATHVLDRIAVR
jgi:hypothetical protein